MNYARHESGENMWKNHNPLNKIYAIVGDKPQKDWTDENLVELVKLLDVSDWTNDTEEIKNLEEEVKHEIVLDLLNEIIYQVANFIEPGDWENPNHAAWDGDCGLYNICAVAVNLVQEWVEAHDITKKRLKKIAKKIDKLNKKTPIDFDVDSEKLLPFFE